MVRSVNVKKTKKFKENRPENTMSMTNMCMTLRTCARVENTCNICVRATLPLTLLVS